MCNQWLIAQPASVQRPVKLYSSHPISDGLHFKNCLLEEGHTHTHTGETHFQTHMVNKGVHTRSNPCRTLISHTLSRAHTLQPRTNSRRVFQGYCPDQMFTIWNSRGRKKNTPSYKNPSRKKLPLDPGVRRLRDPASPRPRPSCGSSAPSFASWGLMICTSTLQGQLPRAFNPRRYDTMLNTVPSISLLFAHLSSSGSFSAIPPC